MDSENQGTPIKDIGHDNNSNNDESGVVCELSMACTVPVDVSNHPYDDESSAAKRCKVSDVYHNSGSAHGPCSSIFFIPEAPVSPDPATSMSDYAKPFSGSLLPAASTSSFHKRPALLPNTATMRFVILTSKKFPMRNSRASSTNPFVPLTVLVTREATPPRSCLMA